MPRSQNAHATAPKIESVREVRPPHSISSVRKRLSKRVVRKTDGRYLIYYEKI